jgi:hypothetical protein
MKIKSTGYYFDGAMYQAFYKGKHIGAFVSRVIAWREIGFQQWGRV